MTSGIVRREFDFALELVTPGVDEDSFGYAPQGVFASTGGTDYSYDAYLPTGGDGRPPVVVFVHGDGPPDVLRGARLWGQYRSWAALVASNGLAAITFDHVSSHGRTKIPAVLDQIRQVLNIVERSEDALGIDARRIAVWSGSAGVPFGFVAALGHSAVRCQVAFYGPMDLRTDDSRDVPDAPDNVLAEYSPITHLERLGAAIQPLFIAKAALDRPGINESIDAFARRASELDAPVEVEVHEEGRHAFDILDEGERSRTIIMRSIGFMTEQLLG